MAHFFSALGDEFAARRRRLRDALGDRNGTILEFVLFAGIIAGMFAVVLGEWRGLAPLIAAVVGYIALDISRQRALASGADEGKLRKRQDRLALILVAAMAVLGTAFLAVAAQPPAHRFTPPPAGEPLDVDLPSPS